MQGNPRSITDRLLSSMLQDSRVQDNNQPVPLNPFLCKCVLHKSQRSVTPGTERNIITGIPTFIPSLTLDPQISCSHTQRQTFGFLKVSIFEKELNVPRDRVSGGDIKITDCAATQADTTGAQEHCLHRETWESKKVNNWLDGSQLDGEPRVRWFGRSWFCSFLSPLDSLVSSKHRGWKTVLERRCLATMRCFDGIT